MLNYNQTVRFTVMVLFFKHINERVRYDWLVVVSEIFEEYRYLLRDFKVGTLKYTN